MVPPRIEAERLTAADGHQMLRIQALITVSLSSVNEMGERMAVATGKSLADLIRERFGVRGTPFAMLLLLIANTVTTMAEFAGGLFQTQDEPV